MKWEHNKSHRIDKKEAESAKSRELWAGKGETVYIPRKKVKSTSKYLIHMEILRKKYCCNMSWWTQKILRKYL